MADAAGLPSLPPTVNLAGEDQAITGDPLAYIQQVAREAIESVNKNQIVNNAEKILFKRYVLKKVKRIITQFKKIDEKYAKPKEEENLEEGDEKDPFADIFAEEAGGDEATKEKTGIATKFVSEIKIHKEMYLKKIRVKREKQEKESDEKKMEAILGKLNKI